jgi:hypothetical protein
VHPFSLPNAERFDRDEWREKNVPGIEKPLDFVDAGDVVWFGAERFPERSDIAFVNAHRMEFIINEVCLIYDLMGSVIRCAIGVEAILSGHTHYGQVANDGRNVAIATRSIGDPEGGPPGYTLLYVRGDDLAVIYRSIEDRGPLALVTHPRDRLLCMGPQHVVQGPDRLVVRVWHSSRTEAVFYRIDEGLWANLEPAGDADWSGPIDGDRLSKGKHFLDVFAIAADASEGRTTIEFFVDPTGRYTAVPEVRPVVTSTAFC